MRQSLALLTLTTAILSAGCSDTNLRQRPNNAPIARALFANSDGDAPDQRLGYTVEGRSATVDGSTSADPDNEREALVYTWVFDSVPDGVDAEAIEMVVAEDNPDTPELEHAFMSFEPPALGTYRLSLTVTDTKDATSQPSIVVVQSIPPSLLEIELQWPTSGEANGADLDLHLLAPGGTYFGEGDCFSWTPNPSWGATEVAEDNPWLQNDHDGETANGNGGPPFTETITLENPMDGDYLILVHYYSDHTLAQHDIAVPTHANVTVEVAGEAISSVLQTPEPMEFGDVWQAGLLSWPEMSVSTVSPEMTSHEALGGPDYNRSDEGT